MKFVMLPVAELEAALVAARYDVREMVSATNFWWPSKKHTVAFPKAR